MRITYLDGVLRLHLTREECQRAYDNIGTPIDLPIGQLKMLKEDVHDADMAHWSKVEVFKAIKEHQVFQKSTSKKKK
jgi:hypothetical protein